MPCSRESEKFAQLVLSDNLRGGLAHDLEETHARAHRLERGTCKVAIPNHEIAQVFVKAREQIDGKQYDATFRAEGIADIEKIGLAYFKDRVEICR